LRIYIRLQGHRESMIRPFTRKEMFELGKLWVYTRMYK